MGNCYRIPLVYKNTCHKPEHCIVCQCPVEILNIDKVPFVKTIDLMGNVHYHTSELVTCVTVCKNDHISRQSAYYKCGCGYKSPEF